MVIFHDMIPYLKEPALAHSALVQLLDGIPFKPKAIHVTKEMAEYLKPVSKLTAIRHFLKALDNGPF